VLDQCWVVAILDPLFRGRVSLFLGGLVMQFDVTHDCRRLFLVSLRIRDGRLCPIFLGFGYLVSFWVDAGHL